MGSVPAGGPAFRPDVYLEGAEGFDGFFGQLSKRPRDIIGAWRPIADLAIALARCARRREGAGLAALSGVGCFEPLGQQPVTLGAQAPGLVATPACKRQGSWAHPLFFASGIWAVKRRKLAGELAVLRCFCGLMV